MRTTRLAGLLVALAMAVAAAPASADCQVAGSLDEELGRARVAFVGTVVDVNGSTATFAVAEVWRGELGQTAVVRGAFDDGSFGEDDRPWELGVTYLVLPYLDGAALRDTICSATTPWTGDLAALRPQGARVPAAETAAPVAPPLAVVGIGLVAVVVVTVSWIAFRRARG